MIILLVTEIFNFSDIGKEKKTRKKRMKKRKIEVLNVGNLTRTIVSLKVFDFK